MFFIISVNIIIIIIIIIVINEWISKLGAHTVDANTQNNSRSSSSSSSVALE